MPMEEETMGLLIGGFIIVMLIAFAIVINLWIKNKQNKPVYIWISSHLILFTFGVVYLIKALNFDFIMQTETGIRIHPKASGEISLYLGMAGVLWALSMACLLTSVIKFSSQNKV